MSDHYDERIVAMRFDNAQFEKGVAQTTSSLDSLKKSLNFDSAEAAARQFDNLSNVDLSKLNKNMSIVAKRMSGFGIMTAQMWERAGNAVLNFGERIYQNTIGQIQAGGKARAQNIANAKFQLEGLGIAWSQIEKDISYGVKDTAYGLDAAAKAAAQLSASGVQLGEDMKAALRGISGVAAMTNTSYEEISPIFTTVAGQGKLMTMQLRQLEARGLNAAATLAEAMNTTEAELRDMVTKGKVSFKDFAEAMDGAFGQHAKDANKTYAGSLSNVKAALSRIGADIETQKLEGMKDVFNALIPLINKFHVEIQPILDRVGLGFRYATTASSLFLKELSGDGDTPGLPGLTGLVDGVVWVMDRIGDLGIELIRGISWLQQFVGYLISLNDPVQAATIVLRLLAGSMLNLVGAITRLGGSGLSGIVQVIFSFGQAVQEALSKNEFFRAGFDAVAGLLQGVLSGIGSLFGIGMDMANSLLGGIASAAGWHSPWDETIRAGEDAVRGLQEGVNDNLSSAAATGAELAFAIAHPAENALFLSLRNVGALLGTALGEVVDNAVRNSNANRLTDTIAESTGSEARSELESNLDGIRNAIVTFEATVMVYLRRAWDTISGFFGSLTPASAQLLMFQVAFFVTMVVVLRAVNAVSRGIARAAKAVTGIFEGIEALVNNIASGIKSLTAAFSNLMGGVTKVLNAQALTMTLGAITNTLKTLFLAVVAFSFMDQGRLWSSVGAITALTAGVGVLLYFLGGMTAFTSVGNVLGNIAIGILALSASLGLLVASIIGLANVQITDQVLNNLAIVGAALGAITLLSALLNRFARDDFSTGIFSILAMAVSLRILVWSLKAIAKIDFKDIGASIAAFSAVVMAMIALNAAISFGNFSTKLGASVGMLMFTLSLFGIIGALVLISKISTDTITRANANIAALGGVFIALSSLALLLNGIEIGGLVKLGGGGLGGGMAMLLLSLSALIMPAIIHGLASIPPGDIEKAGGAVVAFAGLVFTLAMASNMMAKGIASFGLAILETAAGFGVLMATIKYLMNEVDVGQIAGGIISAVVTIGALAIALRLSTGLAADAAGPIKQLTIALVAIGIELALLSFLNWGKILSSAISLGIVLGAVVGILYVAKDFKNGKQLLISVLSVLGLLSAVAVVAALPMINETRILATASAMSTVMLAFGALLLMIKNNIPDPQTSGKLVLSLISVIVPLATALTLVSALGGDAGKIAAAGVSISILLTTMGAFTRIFSDQNLLNADFKSIATILGTFAGFLAEAGIAIGIVSNVGGDPARMLAAGVAISALFGVMGLVMALMPMINFDAIGDVSDIWKVVGIVTVLGTAAAAIIGSMSAISAMAGVDYNAFVPAAQSIGILVASFGSAMLLASRFDFSNASQMTQGIIELAVAMLLMTPVMGSLLSANPEMYLPMVLTITAVMGAMIGMGYVVSRFDKGMLKGALGMVALAGAVALITIPLGSLTSFTGGSIITSMLELAGGLLAVGVIFVAASHFRDDMVKGAMGIAAMALAMLVITVPLNGIMGFDAGGIILNMLALAGGLLAVGAIFALAGTFVNEMIKGALGMGAMALSLLLMTVPLGQIVNFDAGAIIVNLLALAGGLLAVGMIFALAGAMVTQILLGAAGMAALSLAIMLFMMPLKDLVQLDAGAIILTLLSLTGGILALGLVATLAGVVAPLLLAGAAGIAALGGALLLLVPAIAQMYAIPDVWGPIGAIAAAIAILSGVSLIAAIAAPAMIATGPALSALSIGVLNLVPALVALSGSDISMIDGVGLGILIGALAASGAVAGAVAGLLAVGGPALAQFAIGVAALAPALQLYQGMSGLTAIGVDLGLAIAALSASGLVAGAASLFLTASRTGLMALSEGLLSMYPVFLQYQGIDSLSIALGLAGAIALLSGAGLVAGIASSLMIMASPALILFAQALMALYPALFVFQNISDISGLGISIGLMLASLAAGGAVLGLLASFVISATLALNELANSLMLLTPVLLTLMTISDLPMIGRNISDFMLSIVIGGAALGAVAGVVAAGVVVLTQMAQALTIIAPPLSVLANINLERLVNTMPNLAGMIVALAQSGAALGQVSTAMTSGAAALLYLNQVLIQTLQVMANPEIVLVFMNNLINTLGTLPFVAQMAAIGLYQGLLTGVQIAQMGGTMLGLAVLQGAQEALGIHSPSIVFEWIGNMITEGLCNSLGDNAGNFELAGFNMGSLLEGGFWEGFDLEGIGNQIGSFFDNLGSQLSGINFDFGDIFNPGPTLDQISRAEKELRDQGIFKGEGRNLSESAQKERTRLINERAKKIAADESPFKFDFEMPDMKDFGKQLSEVGDGLGEIGGGAGGGGGGGGGAAGKAKEELSKLGEYMPVLQQSVADFHEEWADNLVEMGYTDAWQASEYAMSSFALSLTDVGDLSTATAEEVESAMAEMAEALSNYMDDIKNDIQQTFSGSNFFQEFELKTELSGQKLLENMASRLEGVKKWGAELHTLVEKGLDQGLYQQLHQLGPDGYEYVHAFTQLTADELSRANSMYQESFDLSEGLASQITTDTAFLGLSLNQGFANGILGNEEMPMNAAVQMAMDTLAAMRAELGIASPSTETQAQGVFLLQGLNLGLQDPVEQANIQITLQTLANLLVRRMGQEWFKKERWVFVGKSIVDGIVKGINDNKSRAIEAAAQMAAEALAAAQSELDIASPSGEFMWIGKMIDEGLAKGIADNTSGVISSASGLGNLALDSMRNSLNGVSRIISEDFNPVITPYLDLSLLEAGANSINGFFGRGVAVGGYLSAQQAKANADQSRGGYGDTYQITINSPTTDARTLAREIERNIVRR